MNYANFVKDVPVGASVLIDDGEIAFKVIEKKGNASSPRLRTMARWVSASRSTCRA